MKNKKVLLVVLLALGMTVPLYQELSSDSWMYGRWLGLGDIPLDQCGTGKFVGWVDRFVGTKMYCVAPDVCCSEEGCLDMQQMHLLSDGVTNQYGFVTCGLDVAAYQGYWVGWRNWGESSCAAECPAEQSFEGGERAHCSDIAYLNTHHVALATTFGCNTDADCRGNVYRPGGVCENNACIPGCKIDADCMEPGATCVIQPGNTRGDCSICRHSMECAENSCTGSTCRDFCSQTSICSAPLPIPVGGNNPSNGTVLTYDKFLCVDAAGFYPTGAQGSSGGYTPPLPIGNPPYCAYTFNAQCRPYYCCNPNVHACHGPIYNIDESDIPICNQFEDFPEGSLYRQVFENLPECVSRCGVPAWNLCGDGVRNPHDLYSRQEECDDGNLTDGDGCSATCTFEVSSSSSSATSVLITDEVCTNGLQCMTKISCLNAGGTCPTGNGCNNTDSTCCCQLSSASSNRSCSSWVVADCPAPSSGCTRSLIYDNASCTATCGPIVCGSSQSSTQSVDRCPTMFCPTSCCQNSTCIPCSSQSSGTFATSGASQGNQSSSVPIASQTSSVTAGSQPASLSTASTLSSQPASASQGSTGGQTSSQGTSTQSGGSSTGNACQTDNDCSIGICINGSCVPCTNNDECPNGLICQNGFCSTGGSSVSSVSSTVIAQGSSIGGGGASSAPTAGGGSSTQTGGGASSQSSLLIAGGNSASSDTSDILLGAAICGDGVREPPETCDDGNTLSGDGCSSICRNEQVASAGTIGGDQGPILVGVGQCGNGVLEGAESCDDGNRVSNDGCSNTCRNEFRGCTEDADCANGRCVNGSCFPCFTNDECIVGSCTENVCTTPTLVAAASLCGNGLLEGSEECDDANSRDGDGCSATCLLEIGICGDGKVQVLMGEQCEAISHDPRLPYTCDNCRYSSPTCGDGKVDAGEECDKGGQNSQAPNAACRTTCALARCGDGVKDTGEACDDGNRIDTDGCNRTCQGSTPVTQIAQAQTQGPNTIGNFFTQSPLGQVGSLFTQSPTQNIPFSQPNVSWPVQPTGQSIPFQLPLAQLQPLIQAQGPVGDTGPGLVAVLAGGAASGIAWARRKRTK